MTASPGTMEQTDITVPADLRQVRVLRLVAAGTLSLHDVSTDVIEDLRSAVDEACSLLVGTSDVVGSLRLVLQVDLRSVTAVIRGVFDELPDRSEETTELSTQMLGLFVDTWSIDLDRNRVSFSRRLTPERPSD